MFQSVLRSLRDAQNAELEGGGTAEAGFTLIELMVVLLIIAILLAIAIPTFLGVTGSANDRAAQSNLTNALTEASAAYQSNNQTFVGTASMSVSAPEFTWTGSANSAAAGSNVISMEPVDVSSNGDGQGIILAAESKNSTTCWFAVTLNATPNALLTVAGDTTGRPFASTTNAETGATSAGTYYSKYASDGANCKASQPTSASTWAWSTSYAGAPQA
jgi:prepilin-type N-terminal cleavage/methylation domain-containing protein